MGVVASDIQWFLSDPTASSGNSGSGTPGNSRGGYMSTSQISTTPLDDLFTDITPAENAASQVDYQCLFVGNFTGSGATALMPYVWMPYQYYSGSATIQYGIDPALVTAYNTSTQQAQVISTSTTEPAGITWYQPSTSFLQGIPIGDLAPQQVQAIWFQRTATDGQAGIGSFSVQLVFATT
jgi:hypothetical protein